jgi:hypothetical protein
MKTKNFVWMIGVASFIWVGCAKESIEMQAPKPALDVPSEIAAMLSVEELQDFEDAYLLALKQHPIGDQIYPLMMHMNVIVSRGSIRVEQPGGVGADICISGRGVWANAARMRYFEAIYKPDEQGYWVGEGYLEKIDPGARLRSYLYFNSEPWQGAIYYDGEGGYQLNGLLRIFRGTGDYRLAHGVINRRVFFPEGDYVNGVAVMFGVVIIPGKEKLAGGKMDILKLN